MDDLDNLLSKVRKVRNGEMKLDTKMFWVILLVGLLITVIALPTDKKNMIGDEQKEYSVDERKNMQEELENFLMRVDGVGKVKVLIYMQNEENGRNSFINEEKKNKITGVIVAAEGAYDYSVRVDIVKMIMALYGLDANKIEVFVMKMDVDE